MAPGDAMARLRAKELFSTQVDSAFAFHTSKAITIQDWKIGLMNRILQGGLFVYFILSSFHLGDRLAYYQEAPIGTSNLYVGTSSFHAYSTTTEPEYVS